MPDTFPCWLPSCRSEGGIYGSVIGAEFLPPKLGGNQGKAEAEKPANIFPPFYVQPRTHEYDQATLSRLPVPM